MCWLNHGIAWHIDHIVPKKVFGASREELSIVEWHKNLQPMWAKENLSKSDTYEEVDKIDLIERYNEEHGTKYMQNYLENFYDRWRELTMQLAIEERESQSREQCPS